MEMYNLLLTLFTHELKTCTYDANIIETIVLSHQSAEIFGVQMGPPLCMGFIYFFFSKLR